MCLSLHACHSLTPTPTAGHDGVDYLAACLVAVCAYTSLLLTLFPPVSVVCLKMLIDDCLRTYISSVSCGCALSCVYTCVCVCVCVCEVSCLFCTWRTEREGYFCLPACTCVSVTVD